MTSEASRLSRFRAQGGFFPLTARACIRLTGTDRLRYLNGQVSNDLRKLAAGEAMSALVLTAKGKLCADVFVWNDSPAPPAADDGALLIDADATVVEELLMRLERYAVADDVTFELLPPAARCHVFGGAAHAVAGTRISRLGVAGTDVSSAPSGLSEAGSDEVKLLRIERGVPQWGHELSGNTLPHEAGLDRSAVDFQKGCYVGQEVVSRVQSVGRANRQLTGFVGTFDPENAESATLQTASGTRAGSLCSVAFHPELQKTIALGYVSTRVSEASLSVWNESGACLGRAERSEFPLVS